MHRNLLLHQRALFLRKKKGYSYREIQEEIAVPKSTLSGWLSNVDLTDTQKAHIRQKQYKWTKGYDLGEWNRRKRQKEVMAIRVQSKQEIGKLTQREFLIAGIMLYWAEGSKSGKNVQICNADPSFILFIMEWFRSCLSISEDRFSASVHYHQGQDYMTIERFWSDVAGIPLEQFKKTIL